jgi:hypothetical protein
MIFINFSCFRNHIKFRKFSTVATAQRVRATPSAAKDEIHVRQLVEPVQRKLVPGLFLTAIQYHHKQIST